MSSFYFRCSDKINYHEFFGTTMPQYLIEKYKLKILKVSSYNFFLLSQEPKSTTHHSFDFLLQEAVPKPTPDVSFLVFLPLLLVINTSDFDSINCILIFNIPIITF